MTSTCLFQSGQRSRKSFGACKTCTHVSYQQISILTQNFNTSFVGHLANVATLEYFTLTVFFLRLLLNVVLASGLGVSNVTRGWQFGRENTFFLVKVCFLLDPAETLMSLVSLLSGRQRWKSAEHVALSISVFLSPFYSACLSQCFWNDTERISMSPAQVLTPINREV